jgi:hypothetical protein
MTKVYIFYRNSKVTTNNSPYHTGGLAGNALHSVAVLRSMGVNAHLRAVQTFNEVVEVVKANHVTHAIVEAVWVTPEQVRAFNTQFPDVKLVIRAHSKIGFLQVEPEAIPVMRKIIELSMEHGRHNVMFSSNNQEFAVSLEEVFGPVLYLPNLYDLESAPKSGHMDGKLRIASFGATRLLKLHPAAALAALQIATRLDTDLEFFVNVDTTPGGQSVRNTIRNLFQGLTWAKLNEITWQDTETFKKTISEMDLVLQMSATETFCLVAADAVASGVPVVVGPAISWVPEKYQVNIDNTSEIAARGADILSGPHSVAREQLKSLKKFVEHSKQSWGDFLGLNHPKKKRWW